MHRPKQTSSLILSSSSMQLQDSLTNVDIFPEIEKIFTAFDGSKLQQQPLQKRFQQINETLLTLIQQTPSPVFLLKAVVDFIHRVNEKKIFNEQFKFNHFEFWLNNFSNLSEAENYEIRAKIVGKFIPRETYQAYFPIGMSKIYSGTHFTIAHLSPDVDTMIASFWGWIDSFGARVGNALHSWVLPSGPPDSAVSNIIQGLFGTNLFQCTARTSPFVSLTAIDLVTQQNLIKDSTQDSLNTLNHQNIVTLNSDMEEIKQKLQDFDFITVVIQEHDQPLFPVGAIREKDLVNKGLGTVSLRDFCNREEMRMAPYLEIISVIDHHKASLSTPAVPTVTIGDAQSCNVLIAEHAFKINDCYSLGGMSPLEIHNQIKSLIGNLNELSQTRILQQLLKRHLVVQQKRPFYIHPSREFSEYLSLLYAILDDTDLLTKVSDRDVDCVAQLLNRLKSLTLKREVEIVHFDDLPRDKKFAKAAARRILQQEDMHLLYKEIYQYREVEVENNLKQCLEGESSNIFTDTKEQNGCVRVGQTKLFASNFPYFSQNVDQIRKQWLKKSEEVFQEKPEIDLYIHMISTISSADEVYRDQIGPYPHKDQLWIWIPSTVYSFSHLNTFLTGFEHGLKNLKSSFSVEFSSSVSDEFKETFSRYFSNITQVIHANGDPFLAILHFDAGILNSRKTMITPFLPII